MTTLLPGLSLPIQNGYNVVRADFLTRAVFDLTYNEGKTIQYGPDLGTQGTYDVPDGVDVQNDTGTYSSSSTRLLETATDYNQYYTASVAGTVTSTSFSGSASSSLAYHGQLFTSVSSSYALNFGREKVYHANRTLTTQYLSQAFKDALGQLRWTSTPEDYRAFFDAWGTHYLKYGIFGGFYTMETRIDDTLLESSTSTDVTAGVQAGFNGVVQSGQLSAEGAYGSSSWLSSHRSQTSVTISTSGGTSDESISVYYRSIFANPILLLFFVENKAPSAFGLLSDFMADDADKTRFNEAVQDYIDSAASAEGMLGSPRVQSVNRIYKAKFDGLVTGVISKNVSGDRGYLQAAADGSDNPTTLRGAASMHWNDGMNNWITQSSFTVPVRAGDYDNTTYTTTWGTPPARLALTPFGLGTDVVLGASTDVTVDEVQTAPSDGFVTAMIDCSNNGARGSILGQQGASSDALVTVAGSSAHLDTNKNNWVRCQSFCMPVAAGQVYRVATLLGAGKPTMTACFTPILGGHALLGAMRDRTNKISSQAETDGFVLAYIDASTASYRGALSVSVARLAEDLPIVVPRALTSAYYNNKDDRWLPYNTVMVPVERGSWYQVSMEPSWGSPSVYIRWVPLGQAPARASAPGPSTSAIVSSAGTVKTS